MRRCFPKPVDCAPIHDFTVVELEKPKRIVGSFYQFAKRVTNDEPRPASPMKFSSDVLSRSRQRNWRRRKGRVQK